MGSRVTHKGQVAIPKRVRDHLGIEPGSVVAFEVDADGRAAWSIRARCRNRAGSTS